MTEDRLGEVLCCPPLGFFWYEVFLEDFAHELGLRGGTVGVVLPLPSLLTPLSTPLFSAPPLYSEKYLLPPSLPLLLASLVRLMYMFLFSLEVVMLH